MFSNRHQGIRPEIDLPSVRIYDARKTVAPDFNSIPWRQLCRTLNETDVFFATHPSLTLNVAKRS